ncbi:GtrA family protein [SAR86 cluster bacterium]|nr:GtrA family protein [SAR86 cluster bacterium]
MKINKQFRSFFIVGIIAFSIDISFYYFLTSVEVSVNISKGISFLLGTVFGYFVNSIFTFKVLSLKTILFLRYLGVYILSMILNIFINEQVFIFLHKSMITDQMVKLFSVIFATICSMIFNFVSLKLYVYR